MTDKNEAKKAHGAQSDQGAEGQKIGGDTPQKPYYEGAEETNQQRRAEGRAHYPYEDKEGEADPAHRAHAAHKQDDE